YEANARLLAGGTDLVIMMTDKLVSPEHVIDVKGIPELTRFEWNPTSGLTIGAAVPFRQLETSKEVKQFYSGLYEAASEVGSWQIRNLGTPGGNLCTASPACEIGPILYALEAQVEIAGPRGRRKMPVQQFITGVRRTALEPDELLVDIQVPAPAQRSASHYIKLKERQKMDIAFVGVAAAVDLESGDGVIREARIALGAVAPTPVRAPKAEATLRGQRLNDAVLEEAGREAAETARPIVDVRASAEYRKEMVDVLTRRAVRQALALAAQR
ncbi:MAG: FAD binding domain-containing protein, partial [Chloroflexota bacterium]